MPNDNEGVNIPVTSSLDPAGFDATTAGLQKVQAEIERLKTAGVAASAPIAPPVSVPGAPAAVSTLKQVEEAGTRAAKNTETAFNEANHSADEFIKALRLGTQIEVGRQLVEGLEDVISRFREAIAQGVEYDKEMETLGIGLAAALKQSEPEKYDSFNDALKTSGELLDVVKAKALELNVSTTGLAHTLQVSMLALSEGGIKDLNAQVETTGLLMQAAAQMAAITRQLEELEARYAAGTSMPGDKARVLRLKAWLDELVARSATNQENLDAVRLRHGLPPRG